MYIYLSIYIYIYTYIYTIKMYSAPPPPPSHSLLQLFTLNQVLVDKAEMDRGSGSAAPILAARSPTDVGGGKLRICRLNITYTNRKDAAAFTTTLFPEAGPCVSQPYTRCWWTKRRWTAGAGARHPCSRTEAVETTPGTRSHMGSPTGS